MYKITLADGTIIDNLTLNGDNFISTESINPDIFIGNLSPTIIDDGENAVEHEFMDFLQLKEYLKDDDTTEYWFVIKDITQQTLEQIKIRADIDYIAMVSDIDLD